ncbi:hypothetical protein chiPu_0030537, partial [Chiloscyllium punctatum]|nr:hypothetical protein [Chiloscyllium punctatum]
MGPGFRRDDTWDFLPLQIRALDHLAEPQPAGPFDPLQLQLLQRVMIGRAGVDLDAGQQRRHFDISKIVRLRHDVVAAEVALALLEHDLEHLRHRVGVETVALLRVAVGKVLRHEGEEILHAGIIGPGRIGDVLHISRRDRALRLVEADGRNGRGDRCRAAGDEMHRLPAELIDLADRLRAELCRGARDQHVGIGAAQRDDLGIDGRIGDLV